MMSEEQYDLALAIEVKLALMDVYQCSKKKAKTESLVVVRTMIQKYEELISHLMESEFGGEV